MMRKWATYVLASVFLLAGCGTTKPRRSKRDRVKGKIVSSDVPKQYKKRKNKCEQYKPLVLKYAKKYDLEPELVMGVIKVESGFTRKIKSRVGATGLMQIMPKTGKYMKCGSNLYDPETNIECGCKVLQRYIGRYKGNLIYGLSAYNTGPGNTNPSHRKSKLPFNFRYVEKVFRWRNVFVRFGCH